MGISAKTLQRIEAGQRDLKLGELRALCAATGQDLSFFGASLDVEPQAATLPPPLPGVKPEPADPEDECAA